MNIIYVLKILNFDFQLVNEKAVQSLDFKALGKLFFFVFFFGSFKYGIETEAMKKINKEVAHILVHTY